MGFVSLVLVLGAKEGAKEGASYRGGGDGMISVDGAAWQSAPVALSPGRVLFAIGDVHGHARQLAALHDFIRARIEHRHAGKAVSLVWLGDYIDRGPEPGGTLRLVREGLGLAGVEEVALKGNHEQFLTDVLASDNPDPETVMLWKWNGGSQTIAGLLGRDEPSDPVALAKALRRALGEAALVQLGQLAMTHRVGGYLCVHAGVHPSRSLATQGPQELLWIREPFLSPPHWIHDFVVIHGHTPEQPVVLPHRIGIDSGVFMSGRLTAVEIEGEALRLITAYEESENTDPWPEPS